MIEIAHRTGIYRVHFGSLPEAIAAIPSNAYVITDQNVQAAWGSEFPKSWRVKAVPPGEPSKSLEVYGECLSWLVSSGADRLSTLVAFGGGVVGDLAGFVASSYMRGIKYVQVPTTLLAQVDSSVGGKVAIDLSEGKNLVGAFYPPDDVWICADTLGSLQWREFVNGMAEVWKYGFIMDTELVRALSHLRLTPESPMLESVIRRCVQLKAEIVQADELDTSGLRAKLNFGHTVGHALEKLRGYSGLLHGEAISIGMVAEARIGEQIGITPKGTAEKIGSLLKLDGLPTRSPDLQSPDLVEFMKSDKKTEDGHLAFSLLTQIGECKLVRKVPREEVEAALSAI